MSSMKCPQCGLVNFATAISCRRCGMFFKEIGNAPNVNQHSAHSTFGDGQTGRGNFQNQAQPKNPPNFATQAGFSSPPPYQNYQSVPKQKSGLAVTSMILGIIGCFLTAPLGLILGIVALVKANRHPREYGGKGFAVAGVVLNSLGALVLFFVLIVVIPNLFAARRAFNEVEAISTIRTLAIAEEEYKASMLRCGDIKSLIATRLIDNIDLAEGEKDGYRYTVANFPTGDCEIHATPVSTTYGNRSFFYSTEDGILRAAAKNGLPAGRNDLPLNGETEQFPKIATQKNRR